MIPLTYIPTEVVFVDDKAAFLEQLKIYCHDNFLYRYFTDAVNAVDHINAHAKNEQSFHQFEEVIEPTGYKSFATRCDIASIYKRVFSAERYNEVSVVVADYAMPMMDGLEMLSRIQSPHVKKILLTGEADEKVAVEAFNRGLIHKYIKKSKDGFIEELESTIQQFAEAYWCEKTKMVKDVLAINFPKTPFDNPQVKEHLSSVIKKYGIVEYYLLEGAFRFLLVDAQGKTYILWIQSRDDADGFAYELQAGHPNISSDLMNAVNTYKKILCPPLHNGVMLNVSEWEHFYRDAVKIGSDFEFLSVIESQGELEYTIIPFEYRKKENEAMCV